MRNKWVFKLKRDENGELMKYKVRLVVKGFGQKQGIDFDDIFSPVVKMTSIRMKLKKIHTDKNPSDMLTKIVPKDKLELCRRLVGMDTK
jgi:Reverse transcriptase (RNA-dependent DNA polymerase)